MQKSKKGKVGLYRECFLELAGRDREAVKHHIFTDTINPFSFRGKSTANEVTTISFTAGK